LEPFYISFVPGTQAEKLAIAGDVATQSAVPKNRIGTVLWFDPKACCGFIRPDEGGPDIFARLLQKKGKAMTLAAGNRVRYELVPSTRLVETAAFILAKVN
jgi:cold shock CspA family protein